MAALSHHLELHVPGVPMPRDKKIAAPAVGILQKLIERTDVDDPDIVTKALMAIEESLAGSDDSPPTIPSSADAEIAAQGIIKCLGHKDKNVLHATQSCVGPFAAQVSDKQFVAPIATALCANLQAEASTRDASHLGLKGLLGRNGLKPDMAASPVIEALVQGLLPLVPNDDQNALIHLEQILTKYGTLCTNQHIVLRDAFFAQVAVAAEATILYHLSCCCSALADASSREFLFTMVVLAADKVKQGSAAFGDTIAKTATIVGRKLAHIVPQILPTFIEQLEGDADPDLKSGCINAIAAIIQTCPRQFSAFSGTILEKLTDLLDFGDDGDDLFDGDFGSGDEDDVDDWPGGNGDAVGYAVGDETEENEYDDEDDTSWKVRCAAAKCAESICKLPGFDRGAQAAILLTLVERTDKETATVVKMGLYAAIGQIGLLPDTDTSVLDSLVPKIVTNELDYKSKARIAALTALRSFAQAHGGCFSSNMPLLAPGLYKAVRSTLADVKTVALALLGDLVCTTPAESLKDCIGALSDAVATCIGSDARVCIQSFRQICNFAPAIDSAKSDTLFDAVSSAISGDAHVQVRRAGMTALAALIVAQKDLSEKCSILVSLLMKCLGDPNEHASVKIEVVAALVKLSIAKVPPESSSFAADSATALVSLLAAADRPVVRASMNALHTLSKNYSIEGMALFAVISPMLDEGDLQLSSSGISLCASLLASNSKLMDGVKAHIWGPTFALLRSPKLNKSSLAAIGELVVEIVKTSTADLDFLSIVKICSEDTRGKMVGTTTTDIEISRHTLKSFATCIGAAAAVVDKENHTSAVKSFINSLSDGNAANADGTVTCDEKMVGATVLSLRSLGEIGALVDLSSSVPLHSLFETIDKQSSLEIRKAGIDCVSRLSLGGLKMYVPQIIEAGADVTHPGLQGRILQALSQTLANAASQLGDHVSVSDTLLPVLVANADSPSAEVRQAVGQCLGNLVAEPATVVELQKLLTRSSKIKQTVINAARDALKSGVDFDLDPFVSLITDSDDGVKEACLLTLNEAIRKNSPMVAALSSGIIPDAVYDCAIFQAHKVQVVDLGGMRHLLDRGEGVRKAAFETLEALVSSEEVEKNLPKYMVVIASGLAECRVLEVTLFFVVGKGEDDAVSIVAPSPTAAGGPGPGHAAFIDARQKQIAAALDLPLDAIEFSGVKKSGKAAFKEIGVVEVSFYVRAPGAETKIKLLKEQVQNSSGIVTASSVKIQPWDEKVKSGGIQLQPRVLDKRGVEEVAMIIIRKAAKLFSVEMLSHLPILLAPLQQDAMAGKKPYSSRDKQAEEVQLRWQHKCLETVRVLATVEDAETTEMAAYIAELEAGPLAEMWQAAGSPETQPEPDSS